MFWYTSPMNRSIVSILALIVLIGVGYIVYTTAQEGGPSTGGSQTEGTLTEKNIAQEDQVHAINVTYPQFGLREVDTRVQKAVDVAVDEIRAMPQNPPEMASPQNTLDGQYGRTHIEKDIASVEMRFSVYTGGVHPNLAIVPVNVNRALDQDLTLDDALKLIGMTLTDVATKAKADLTAALGEDVIFPEGADPKPEHYSTFLVDEDSVTFIFQVYQVAPYSAGPQEVTFARR